MELPQTDKMRALMEQFNGVIYSALNMYSYHLNFCNSLLQPGTKMELIWISIINLQKNQQKTPRILKGGAI